MVFLFATFASIGPVYGNVLHDSAHNGIAIAQFQVCQAQHVTEFVDHDGQ